MSPDFLDFWEEKVPPKKFNYTASATGILEFLHPDDLNGGVYEVYVTGLHINEIKSKNKDTIEIKAKIYPAILVADK